MNVSVTQAHIDAGDPLQLAILEQRDLDVWGVKEGSPTVDIDPSGRVDMNGVLLVYQLPASAKLFKDAYELGGKDSVVPFAFVLEEK